MKKFSIQTAFALSAVACACAGQAQAETVRWRATGVVNKVDYARPVAGRPADPVKVTDTITMEFVFDSAAPAQTSWKPFGVTPLSLAPVFGASCNLQYPIVSAAYRIGNGPLVDLPAAAAQATLIRASNCVGNSLIGGVNTYVTGSYLTYIQPDAIGADSLGIRQPDGSFGFGPPKTASNANGYALIYSESVNTGPEVPMELNWNKSEWNSVRAKYSLVTVASPMVIRPSTVLSLATTKSSALAPNVCGTSTALTSTPPKLTECVSDVNYSTFSPLYIPWNAWLQYRPAVETLGPYPHISMLMDQEYDFGTAAPFERRHAVYLAQAQLTAVERFNTTTELVAMLRQRAASLGILGVPMNFALNLIDQYVAQNKPAAACVMVAGLKTIETILRPYGAATIDSMLVSTAALSKELACPAP